MQVLHKRAKNVAVPGGTFEKGPSKGVTNLCFFWKLRRPKLTRERQNDSRRVRGVENINYSIIMCDAQWEKEGRGRGRRREREGRTRLCLRQWENFVWQQWLICGKNIPQRVTEKLWTPDTSRHCGTEKGKNVEEANEAEEFKAKENSFRLSSYNLILNVLIDWPENGTRSKP